MPCTPGAKRSAFTLLELILVIAIIALLVGLLLPAVQKVREAAARIQCANNLKQIALATQAFANQHNTLPTYHGVFPASGGNTWPSAPGNTRKVYGSWFAHLLPYVEQDNVYRKALDDINASPPPGHNEPYWDVPPTYTYGPLTVEQYNGHDFITSLATASGGSGLHVHGIWIEGVHQANFKLLRCPSDPGASPDELVYGYWGATNYLANYNAFSSNRWGLWCNPVPLAYFKDGLSNTVLYGEGYADCDRIGRIALYAWWYHNFGLDWYQQPNTNLFQTNPAVKDCDNWRAQSGHSAGMNVALADGSVRLVAGSVSQATWTAALLPQDGAVPGGDW